jgi:hypothetical protein
MAVTPTPQNSLASLQQKAAPKLGAGVSAMQAVAQQVPVAQPSQQEGLKKLVQAATTGTASGEAGGPKASNVGEMTAQASSVQAQQQATQEAQNQDEAMRQQEEAAWMELDDNEFQVREQAVGLKSQFNQKMDEILTTLEQNREELSLDQQKALTEQAGFYMRLNNEKYVNKLKTEGARARLDSTVKFKEAMMNSIFKNQYELMNKNLSLKTLLSSDDRAFRERLGRLDINAAIALLSSELDTAKEQNIYKGAQETVSGVSDYYAKQQSQPTNSAPKSPSNNAMTQWSMNNAEKYGTAGGGSDNNPDTPY